jgi:uncharacterized phiE125 gp8 family phage protein
MELTLLTAPAAYPVSLAEAKLHLRVDTSFTTDDDLIRAHIAAASDMAERFLHRRLVSQSWRAALDDWPAVDFIRLPYGRLQSVTQITYLDSDGDSSTFSSDDYIVQAAGDPGRVVLGYGKSWPSTTLYPSLPISIDFTCGYYGGASAWAVGTTYAAGDLVYPTTINGLVYEATAGDSHAATEPTWPMTIGGTVVDNEVTWTCKGLAVPETIKSAIKLLVSDLYDVRENTILGTISKNRRAAEALLAAHTLHGVTP